MTIKDIFDRMERRMWIYFWLYWGISILLIIGVVLYIIYGNMF